jgi:hypothetical protein
LVGERVGGFFGAFVGKRVGRFAGDFVGERVGVFFGALVGERVGGAFVGERVGRFAGAFVGDRVGGFFGAFVGGLFGAFAGERVGGFFGAFVGTLVRTFVGTFVGASVGERGAVVGTLGATRQSFARPGVPRSPSPYVADAKHQLLPTALSTLSELTAIATPWSRGKLPPAAQLTRSTRSPSELRKIS